PLPCPERFSSPSRTRALPPSTPPESTLPSLSFFGPYGGRLRLPSFPTRRSSDLDPQPVAVVFVDDVDPFAEEADESVLAENGSTDRKSTRLNSSHVSTSYAVFCLTKKKKNVPHLFTTVPPGLRVRKG